MVTSPTPEPLNEATVVSIIERDISSLWYSGDELEAFLWLIQGEYNSGDTVIDIAVKLDKKKNHIVKYYGGSPTRAKNYKERKGFW